MRRHVNGIEVDYQITGKSGAATVVLSHSLGSSSVMWGPQVEALSTAFQVLVYDARGHGGSGAPPGAYDLDELGADALALLETLKIDRVHWVGLSMGGMIGQSVALRCPERLVSLALCDTMAIVPEAMQQVWVDRIQVARELGMTALVDETMERWFTADFRNAQPHAIAPIRAQFLATSAAGYIGCCEAIRRLNFLPRLSSVQVPTLILVGAEDPATPPAAAQAMHDNIPGSKLVVIPDAAHLSNIEQSSQFNKTLMQFLSRHA